ncbi:MAG TPA: hypothetical protein VJJ22_00435 [Candidatus Paceibacterota bacterium]
MTKQVYVAIGLALLSATVALAGSTTLIRHESGFVHGSPFQLNSDWLIHSKGNFQGQLYTLWESSSHTWKEVDAAVAPIFSIPHASISFPVGLRLHPEEGWRMSHVITKANVFGKVGNFPFFLVNDLSWAMGGRGRNEHFIQQQFAWQPKDSRVGLGIQTEQVLLGNTSLSIKVGPVIKLTYAKSANWAWTLDIVPFYDMQSKKVGVKANFLTFHFRK